MDRTLAAIEASIGRLTAAAGRLSSFLLPLLMLAIVVNVVLRYGFRIGSVELEELQWHLNATMVLLCLAYAYRDDVHVRVDVLHGGFSPRRKAVVEIAGALLLLAPFVIGVGWFAWRNFAYSWSIGEGSPMPSGLPARYVIKFVLFAGFVLLALQGVAAICRAVLTLRSGHDDDAGKAAQ